MPRRQDTDPYAPPPMHHDRSGAVLRIAIIALMLGAAAWGYKSFVDQQQTALVPEVQEQTLADASDYDATPLPEATSESPPAEEPAPARTPHRAAPPPFTTGTPSPTPIPPADAPS